MGVDITSWRGRIGVFYGDRHGLCNYRPHRPSNVSDNLQHHQHAILPMVVICVLLILGGIELNPGPEGRRNKPSASEPDWKKELLGLKEEIETLKKDNKKLQRRVDFLEKQSKKNNVMIYGIEEPGPDAADRPISSDVCEKLSENLGLTVTDDDVEVVHRIGKRSDQTASGSSPTNRNSGKSRPILCRFKTQQLRDKILAKVRSLMSKRHSRIKLGSLRVTEDFPERVRNVRRKLVPHLKQLKEEHKDESDFKCFLQYDKLHVNGILYSLNLETDELIQTE